MPDNQVLLALLPEHALLLGMLALIVLSLGRRGVVTAVALGVGTVAVVGAVLAAFVLAAQSTTASLFDGQLLVSPSVYVTKALLLALSIPVLLMSRTDFEGAEFPLLLLSSLYGLSLLPSAQSALVLFLGLEMLSVPVYALIVLAMRRAESAEAALKYLVLSGTASAVFLMGIALLYGTTGSMQVSAVAEAMAMADPVATTGLVLVVAALFLKGAVVPFHGWAPDTYEGASVPVTAYMATLSKAAVLVVGLQLFQGVTVQGPLVQVLAVLPLISIVWGNVAAMRQDSLRRMMAYSSIAHAGYLFYAFLGDPATRSDAIVFYLVTYAAGNLLAFAVLPPHDNDVTRDAMGSLDGLFRRRPMAAALMAVAMFSLAGLPPFPGFTAKFLIFRTVVAAGYPVYAVLGLVGSFLGLFFYLRVVQRLFMRPVADEAQYAPGTPLLPGDSLSRTAGVLCGVATLLLTLVPGWILSRV